MKKKIPLVTLVINLFFILNVAVAGLSSSLAGDSVNVFSLSNDKIRCNIVILNGIFDGEMINGRKEWLAEYDSKQAELSINGGFSLKFVWTDWRAPGKQNNADNPVILTQENFIFKNAVESTSSEGDKTVSLFFEGIDIQPDLKIEYHLKHGQNFIRRKIAVRDTNYGFHFLEEMRPADMTILVNASVQSVPSSATELIKSGDFGQSVAFIRDKSGFFIGLEYPASQNHAMLNGNDIAVVCSQETGKKVGKEWIESDWVVIGVTPEPYVWKWFQEYMKDIRVAPLKPYALYNSWYDLRSPEYPGVKPENVMNTGNIMKIIDLFDKNMIQKHHLHLDAFVLDDGWDVYESDWLMRKEQFPGGLKPVSDKLKTLGTDLGIWFGPTGGYSFRMRRINWMKQHGYETVGVGRDYEMLCLGGRNYSDLFRKRTTDLVANEGVAYFKWDGIQFSCSEPGHGHPVGINSRDAILESLIDKCKAVRAANPNTFLNITSGTWLSPWWVKYANTIWMDGEDYGFADVPSITQRDAAITYRDFVLYDDFRQKGLWFPIANLMTHGIIKGNLERLGGEYDPLDKFTDDVVMYFARGVSMYELYISPDLLTDGEWDAIGKSMTWAKQNFDILMNTTMIGGNPMKKETYGYAHFKGSDGILALRNPVIESSSITVDLDPAYGLDPKSKDLIIERIYPDHFIFPGIYQPGSTVSVPLNGFETVILRIYPGDKKSLTRKEIPEKKAKSPVSEPTIDVLDDVMEISVNIDPSVKEGRMAFLLKPSEKMKLTKIKVFIDQIETPVAREEQEGVWTWISVPVSSGNHKISFRAAEGKNIKWRGTVSTWLLCKQAIPEGKMKIKKTAKTEDLLPRPYPAGMKQNNVFLGEKQISFKAIQ